MLKLGLIAGHFATNHSHINTYLDMTTIKTQYRSAREAAHELAKHYQSKEVNTILCFEGTEVIGAFLAHELYSQAGTFNAGQNISVITPETNINNQMIFRDNLQKYVYNQHILLLMSSVSTGKSIARSVDCLTYYSGRLTGIAAIFSALPEYSGVPIDSVFTTEDIPNYQTALPAQCPLCQKGVKVDAIVNSFGYSKI